MSPAPQFHAKQEQHDGGAYDHSPLKITTTNNKGDSNFIRRLPPPPSSTGSSTDDVVIPTNRSHQQQQPPPPPPPRRPVIIYTHSPKVIHTHPRDFMALVQKLTGYTPPPEETQQPAQQQQQHPRLHHQRGGGGGTAQGNVEDNESANSVVTEEHGSSVNDMGPQVNSCFVDNGVGVGINVAPPPPPSYNRTATGYDPYNYNPTAVPPVFQTNGTDFLCTPSHQLPFYNPDSMFMNRNSLSSSRVLKEYTDI